MATIRGILRSARHARPQTVPCLRRCASNQAAAAPTPDSEPTFLDLEKESSFATPPLPTDVKVPSPQERAAKRNFRLPGSRYQFHPPKYDRGPLHPVQSPPSSDPVARDFVPGPFNMPRLRETYHATVAADIMTLAYTHVPPGTPRVPTPERLRAWDGLSPYHKNRSLRQPRGGPVLRPVEHDITFRNIPEIRSITLSAFEPEVGRDKDHLIVVRTALQAITGIEPEITKVKRGVSQWGIIKGYKSGAKVTVHGHAAYELLDKCIHLVFPRIKDWEGVRGSTGDSGGNLSWGLRPQDMAFFPEIEINHTMYPTNMIPGCRFFVETTAKSDRHARLLLKAFGLPFYGKLRD